MTGKRLLEWSLRSQMNVAEIRDYIAADNPQAAIKVLVEIRQTANTLIDFPMMGHAGRRAGTRELVITRYPYVIIYRLTAKKIFVAAILHQSRTHF